MRKMSRDSALLPPRHGITLVSRHMGWDQRTTTSADTHRQTETTHMNLDPLDLVEQQLHQNGKTLTRKHNTIQAQCPHHPDRTPSLSVSRGGRRNIVLHCFAGCDPNDILTDLQLTWSDLEPTETTTQPDRHYIYSDRHGEILYRVVRTPDKRFYQQRQQNGQWVSGLGDTQRTLYRLPAVYTAIGKNQPVWVVEGEKDADRMTHLGHTATTNSGGAGRFTTDMAAHLTGAEVHIVADQDDPGKQHAKQTATLLKPYAHRVTIWHPTRGKDISEHLANGGTLDDLTPEPTTPTEHDPDPLHIVNWDTFWHKDHHAEQWLAYPIIAAERLTAIYAPAKAGKSTIVLAVAAAAATGKPVLGQWTPPHPVDTLYCDYEMTEADLYERLSELGYSERDDLSHFHYSMLPSIAPLDTEPGAAALIAKALELNVKLIVIDTFGRAVEGDENESDTVRRFYRLTGKPLKHHKIAVVRTDHSGKDLERGQRGSSAKNDDVDIVWRLTRTEQGVRLQRTHSRVAWVPEKIEITKHENDDTTVSYLITERTHLPAGTHQLADILHRLGAQPGVRFRDAAQLLRSNGHKASNATVKAAIQQLRIAKDTPT